MSDPRVITVGIDIDGVLGDLNASMVNMVDQALGLKFKPEDCDRWDYWLDWMGKSTMLGLMDDCWNFGYVPDAEAGLSKTIQRLRTAGHGNRFRVMIISKRGPHSHTAVVKWLHARKIKYDSISFPHHEESKFSYPIDILIDDRGKFVEEVQHCYFRAMYLRDQPWNQEVEIFPKNAKRVGTVAEAVQDILDAYPHLIKVGKEI